MNVCLVEMVVIKLIIPIAIHKYTNVWRKNSRLRLVNEINLTFEARILFHFTQNSEEEMNFDVKWNLFLYIAHEVYFEDVWP